ncbi:MAG: methyltransferase domain-containing protein [Anaerolineae bacterium]|nr:methyltransferase domain-containing protein [Anaerolineae bacterium]
MPQIVVNLGSGRTPKTANHILVDRIPYPEVDIVHDLEVYPWPLEDNCCDCIVANHLLEHLHDTCAFMDECWRILRPGGVLHIEVPDAAYPKYAWSDPTHVRPFTRWTWDYFTKAGLAKRAYAQHAWRIILRKCDGKAIKVDLIPEDK